MNKPVIITKLEKELNCKFIKGNPDAWNNGYSTDADNNIIELSIVFPENSNLLFLEKEILKKHLKILHINSLDSLKDITSLGKLANLKELYLSGEAIYDISTIENLKQLKSLKLSCKSIRNISAISKLENITYLEFNGDNIYDISTIEKLTNLRTLKINGDNIHNISVFEKLNRLEILDFSGKRITDYSPISKLEQLIKLDIYFYNNSDISILGKLKTLKQLDLSGDNICDISTIGKLRNLEILKLRLGELNIECNNNLIGINEINKLKRLVEFEFTAGKIDYLSIYKLRNLKRLNLSFQSFEKLELIKLYSLEEVSIHSLEYNKFFLSKLLNLKTIEISDSADFKENRDYDNSLDLKFDQLENIKNLSINCKLGNFYDIAKLTNLETIELTNCEFKDNGICNIINKLKNLNEINLIANNLNEISLTNLKFLKRIDLDYNDLSKIIFKNLPSLEILYLPNNNLSDINELCQTLQKIPNLNYLNLDNNNISDITGVKYLNQIKELVLSNNKGISNLYFLKELKYLRKLDLTNSSVSDISSIKRLFKIKDFEIKLQKKNIVIPSHKNIILKDLPVIIQENNYKYLRDRLKNKKVENKIFENKKIEDWFEFKIKRYNSKMIILGDGGVGKTSFLRKLFNINANLPTGQESTHGISTLQWQYKDENTIANIWDFGGQEIYKKTHNFFLTENSLFIIIIDTRANYQDLQYWLHIISMYKTSRKLIIINEKDDRKIQIPVKNIIADFGLNEDNLFYVNFSNNNSHLHSLINFVKQELNKVKIELLESEIKVAESILNLNSKEIQIRELIKIVEKKHLQSLSYIEIENLIMKFIHLGIIIKREKTLFIDTEWLLANVYKILDNKMISEERQGRITSRELTEVLRTKIYSNIEIENSIYKEDFIELMKKFNLLFKKDDNYIIPQLLPIEDIKIPNGIIIETINPTIIYEYKGYMPHGILWNFIIEKNELIKDDLVWRFGVILQKNSAIAKITENYWKNKITIFISGENKEELNLIIAESFRKIHKKMNIEPNELISASVFEKHLRKSDFESFFKEMNTTLTHLNFELLTNENSFHGIFMTILLTSKIPNVSELHNLIGRSDNIAILGNTAYIFELKFIFKKDRKKTEEEKKKASLLQIIEKEYFNNALFIDDKISNYHLFGVNYNENTKKIDKVVHLKINKSEKNNKEKIKNLLIEIQECFNKKKISNNDRISILNV